VSTGEAIHIPSPSRGEGEDVHFRASLAVFLNGYDSLGRIGDNARVSPIIGRSYNEAETT
jgi:hypothetical protein